MDKNTYLESSAALEKSLQEVSFAEKGLYVKVKRLLDICMAVTGLILTLPITIITMICIYIESPGTVLYRQERVGYKGKNFEVLKLRSMTLDAEKNGAQWAEKNDPRITKVGAFIRKTRIDELPQLINVLKGEMSVIGPRPERPVFTIQFNEEIPGFYHRLSVKPGLTGWAQVNGGYDISPKEKFALDMYYIRNIGLKMDLVILLKTVKVVLTGDGAR